MKVVNIPDPCSEDFSKMSPVEKGFHCESCRKVVIDFTKKSDEEISTFLHENQGKKACGRFRLSQVVKHHTFGFQVVRFAAALLLAFGSFLFTGCDDPEPRVMGEMCVPPPDSVAMAQARVMAQADSTRTADSLATVSDSTNNSTPSTIKQ